MMTVANNAAKGIVIDEDVMARLGGWTLDKFQARWDGNYAASGTGALHIVAMEDLNCSRAGGYRIGSDENVSSMQCDLLNRTPSTIGLASAGTADGNLSKGIEQLNGGSEPITITPAEGTPYTITATYNVRYVTSTVSDDPSGNPNIKQAIWRLGSSDNMAPDGWTAAANATHLKRIVTRFNNPGTQTDIVLTFFKSNKGN